MTTIEYIAFGLLVWLVIGAFALPLVTEFFRREEQDDDGGEA